MDNQTIIDNAIDEVVKEKPSAQESPREMVERVANKFIQSKIEEFPRMCDVAYVMNKEKQKELQEIGRKGKFTDTYGWSEDGSTLATYDIPQDLYNFMRIFVYQEFWGNENKEVADKFMKKVCRGMISYDAMALFVKLKKHYGNTGFVNIN